MPTIFHMPLFWIISKKFSALWNLRKKLNAEQNYEDSLFLFYDPTAFKSEIYLTTSKKTNHEKAIEITGNFYSKVYDGKYKEIPKFMENITKTLQKKQKKVKKIYIHYAYCPKCIKKYGHNYMTLFAELE